jgi:hypothetical protein
MARLSYHRASRVREGDLRKQRVVNTNRGGRRVRLGRPDQGVRCAKARQDTEDWLPVVKLLFEQVTDAAARDSDVLIAGPIPAQSARRCSIPSFQCADAHTR